MGFNLLTLYIGKIELMIEKVKEKRATMIKSEYWIATGRVGKMFPIPESGIVITLKLI